MPAPLFDIFIILKYRGGGGGYGTHCAAASVPTFQRFFITHEHSSVFFLLFFLAAE
jgi:hypothetical protein